MNLNRFLTFSKYALLSVVALTLGMTACNDDDDGPKVYNGTTLALIQDAQFKQSATVSEDVALDSLVKYLTIYPELTALLDGSAEYTLFAPSNKAFINLIATPGFPTNIKLISPDIIKSVLAYHLVEGKKLKADLSSGTVLDTKFTDPLAPGAPQKITVNADGTLIAAPNATNTSIDIVKADVQSSNGVVHVVESVMIPPSTGLVLVPILGKVAGTILLGKDFTNLAKIILSADAIYTEDLAAGKLKVSTWLAMPIATATAPTYNVSGITFFAAPNAVLTTPILTAEIANSIISAPDKGRSYLLSHLLIDDQYTVADFEGTEQFETAAVVEGTGNPITVSKGTVSAENPYGVAVTTTNPPNPAGFRPLVKADLAHSNGVMHVFAGVF
jgi:uncharacterized surface protein with fasciclin (FAS1) repeats